MPVLTLTVLGAEFTPRTPGQSRVAIQRPIGCSTCARQLSHSQVQLLTAKQLLKSFQPLAIEKCSFANLPTSKSGHWGEGITADGMWNYVWLRPEIAVEIKFAEWTKGGLLRHAEFEALRYENDPNEVIQENIVQGMLAS